MTKKNDKRLCWNCDGNVSLLLPQCPYCGVDLSSPVMDTQDTPSHFSFSQSSPLETQPPFASIFSQHAEEKRIPAPPFSGSQDYAVSEEEWNEAMEEKEVKDEPAKNDHLALLLLVPGIIFCLFGLMLLMFSKDGILTLEWNESFAYFYFLGALPLLFFGWKALR